MARKTYYGLKYDGKHLEDGDHLLIHGIEYEVCTSPCYFLHATGLDHTDNGIVFKKVFGLSIDEARKWAIEYKSLGYGFFPEFEKEEDFRKFIISIYERPEYKVGDYVTILERTHDAGDYPYSFTNSMIDYCGRTYKIKSVESAGCNIEDCVLYNGDPQIYRFEGRCIGYSWHQSMFRKATEDEIKKCRHCDSSSHIGETIHLSKDHDYTIKECQQFVISLDSELRLPKNINKVSHINL